MLTIFNVNNGEMVVLVKMMKYILITAEIHKLQN